jgi:hypothetical protein
MSRTATAAQIEAAQTNGRRSLGPITAEGRMAAARNSTKHGMTGLGKCLPPDMEVELAAEVEVFAATYQPRDDYERDLIRRAALGNLRSRRLHAAANAHADERSRNATRRWDEARAAEVAALADRLDAEPAEAVRLLSRLAEGCDYLGDAWESLGEALKAEGRWDEAQARRALHLLGVAGPPSPESTGPLAEFWGCVLALRSERNPSGALPEPSEARDLLRRFVRDRAIESERRGIQVWTLHDEPSRKSAATRAAFDAGPDAARLERYIKDAERMRDRSLAELNRLRRDERLGRLPAPARDEPEPWSRAPMPSERIEPEPPARDEPERPTTEPGWSSELEGLLELVSIRPGSRPTLDRLVSASSGVETLPVAIGRRVQDEGSL